MDSFPDPIMLIGGLALLALVPFAAVMVTSFVKIVVVLALLRNALGIQQIPPNIAMHGLALVLTIYIMAPVGYEIANIVQSNLPINFEDSEHAKETFFAVFKPIQEFLSKFANPTELQFFLSTAEDLWPEEMRTSISENHVLILLPTFVVSELTSAFEIGFLLYLPFIAIDLIVSNILLAMGMMMVSPMTISLPLKLLLFVLLDGWAQLIHGLVLSYL